MKDTSFISNVICCKTSFQEPQYTTITQTHNELEQICRLSAHLDTLQQAVKSLMNMAQHNDKCKATEGTEYERSVYCPKSNNTKSFGPPLHQLYEVMTTVEADNQTISDGDKVVTTWAVGEIQRPRLCVFPALLLLLFLIACVIRCTKGKQDLAFKLRIFASRLKDGYGARQPILLRSRAYR